MNLIILGIKASLVMTVLALGLTASAREATSVVRRPSRLVRSLTAMMLVVPALTLVLAHALTLRPAVKIALVALSLSPVPPFWPRTARKAGGEESYTIGLLVATTLISIVYIPAALDAIGRILSLPLTMSARTVGKLVAVSMLLPLFAGIGIRKLAPHFAARVAKPVGVSASLLLVATVIPMLWKGLPLVVSLVGDGTLLAMLGVAGIALGAGHLAAGAEQDERSVLALACASRHPAIAAAIAHVNFSNQRLVPATILLYLLVSFAASAPYIKWSKRHAARRHKPAMATR